MNNSNYNDTEFYLYYGSEFFESLDGVEDGVITLLCIILFFLYVYKAIKFQKWWTKPAFLEYNIIRGELNENKKR